MKTKDRNEYVDILRGMAMLMVVLGHTITGKTSEWNGSFIFNVIWCLQMPLFILISGYVTRYSSKITSVQMLFKYLKKRTIAYLLPWVVWTVGVRGIVLGEKEFLNPKYILWNMDSGYWFLFSIWTISIVFLFSQYIRFKIYKGKNVFAEIFCVGIPYLLAMALLLFLGIKMDMNFLAIKLTLYYMPFYFIGFMFGRMQNEIMDKINHKMIEGGIAVCFFITVIILAKVNLMELNDSGVSVLVRAAASLMGCVAFSGIVVSFIRKTEAIQTRQGYATRFFNWLGKNSLEIYIIHGLFLHSLEINVQAKFLSVFGFMNVIIVTTFILIGSEIILKIIKANKYTKFILFGK